MSNIKIEESDALLKSIAARFKWAVCDNIDAADLLQEARLAAIKCASAYTLDKGPWPPFCDTCVHRHLMAFTLGERSTVHVPARVQRQRRAAGIAQCRAKVQPSADSESGSSIEDLTSTSAELSAFSPALTPSAEDAAITSERSTLAHELLTVLDERERTAIQRTIFEGATQAKVAAEMGCSRALVAALVARSIEKMQAEAARLGREP